MVNAIYNTTKKLPIIPPVEQTTNKSTGSGTGTGTGDISTQLQMIDESFEDVTLDIEMEKLQNKMLTRYRTIRRGPLNQQQQKYNHHHHQWHLPATTVTNCSTDLLMSSSPTKQTLLTPSQKLRVRRKKLNEELESSIRHEQEMSTSKNKDIDSLSDDELPDDFIVYNVPLSKSLKALSSKEQFIMNQPFVNNYVPHSYYAHSNSSISLKRSSSLTDSNRSSVFSYNSTLSNLTDDNLSSDLKFFTIEMNRNIKTIQNEESQQRIFQLKKLMSQQNQSHESVYSNSSQSSLVSESTSKYFSNTRPNNLPPKDKFESLKHSKDYESILNHALKQEQEKCKLQNEFLKINERQRERDSKQWVEISTNLKENLSKTSTRELWWRGIPINLRPKIWCEQIGNKLQIEEKTVIELFNNVEIKLEIFTNINLCCFPNLAIFNNNETLLKIISAYMQYTNSTDEDIGLYSLAATLLHNIKTPVNTFIALCNILHRKLSYSFMNDIKDEYMNSQIASFDKIFTRKLNRLSTNFKIYKLSSYEFLKPLCSYCLTQYMELSKSSMLIDIYLFEGDSFLLRCALGFLQKIDYKLFGDKNEVMQILGQDCLINLNQHLFNNSGENELIYGFRYLDLGIDEEFFKTVRNVLRD